MNIFIYIYNNNVDDYSRWYKRQGNWKEGEKEQGEEKELTITIKGEVRYKLQQTATTTQTTSLQL